MKYLRKIIILTILIIFFICTKVYAKDVTIVIDPGHGGIDIGSSNKSAGIIERDVNLKIATYLKQYLEEYAGVNVFMTHNGFSSGTMDLLDRALVARKNNADLFISIHCNASDTSSSVNGAEAFVTANKSLPKYNQECSRLANMILDNISKLGIRRIGVKTRLSSQSDEVYSDGTRGDYYGVIRYAMKGIKEGPGANIQNGEGIPTVLVEHCYIQNGDEKYINNESGIQNLARADSNAITEFFGLKQKNKIVSSISLDNTNLNLVIGDETNLNAVVYPETAENKSISWSSSNENVAKIIDGKVTAVSPGDAIITAKTNDGGYMATCNISVKDANIELDTDTIYVLQGEKTLLTYRITPYMPKGYSVKTEIMDENIASFENDNLVNAKNIGETSANIKLFNLQNEIISQKEIRIKVKKLEENEYIKIENYKEKNDILTGISPQTRKEDFLKNISVSEGLEVIIDGDKENITTETNIIIKRKSYIRQETIEKEVTLEDGTISNVTSDTTVEVPEEVVKIYTCIVYGDVNGDGEITPADYVRIKNHIMNVMYIDNLKYKAADVDKNNNITPADYVRVKNHIMKVKLIDI